MPYVDAVLAELPDAALKVVRRRGITSLFPPQEQAVRAGLFRGRSLLLSTGTASGKSFLAELLLISAAVDWGVKGILTVPLRSLAYERAGSIRMHSDLGFDVAVSTGEYDSLDGRLGKSDVMVLTYEKLDSILRRRPRWLSSVGVLVVDELHYINDPKRGPTIEASIMRARAALGDIQILGLSATLSNAAELAEWLGAGLVASDWRPVPLREGVYVRGRITFVDGETRALDAQGGPVESLVRDTVASGGQALVFASTRASAVNLAQRVSAVLEGLCDPPVDVAREVESSSPSRNLGERLAKMVMRCAAFHHAGLDMETRNVVERGFRRGDIRAVVATTTLAAGLNLPARRVIVAEYKRYEPGIGWEDMPVSDYKQMAGRAGRPGLDDVGEAVLVASDGREAGYLFERYIRGAPEPVKSKMLLGYVMRAQALSAVASGYARTVDDVEGFFRGSLAYGQSSSQHKDSALRSRVLSVIEELERNGFVELQGSYVYPTSLGRRVNELYLDPDTAGRYLAMTRSLGDGALEHYVFIVASSDEVPKLRFRKSGDRWVQRVASRLIGDLGIECEDYECEAETMSTVKTAVALSDWADEVPEDTLMQRYDLAPGDLKTYSDLFDWLGRAAARLADYLGLEHHARGFETARLRVMYGVREELLELVQLPGVGRIRARALYNAGFRTLDDVASARVRDLVAVRGIGDSLARSIIGEARRLLNMGHRRTFVRLRRIGVGVLDT